MRARLRRFLSPPDKRLTFFCWSPLLKLNHERYARLLIVRGPRVISSAPSVTAWNTDSSGSSSPSLFWSTYMTSTVSPTTSSPMSGVSSPAIMFSSVDCGGRRGREGAACASRFKIFISLTVFQLILRIPSSLAKGCTLPTNSVIYYTVFIKECAQKKMPIWFKWGWRIERRKCRRTTSIYR